MSILVTSFESFGSFIPFVWFCLQVRLYTNIYPPSLVILCSWKSQCLVDRLPTSPWPPANRLEGRLDDCGRKMYAQKCLAQWVDSDEMAEELADFGNFTQKKLGFSHQEMEVSCHGSAQKWMVYNGKSMGNPIKMEAFGDKNWQAQMRFEGLGKLNIWPIAKAGAPSNYGSQGRQGKGSGSCDGVVSEWGMFFGGFTYFEYTFFKTIYIYNMCACVACVFVGPPKIGKNGRMTSKPLVPHGSTLMTIGFYFHSDYGVW